MTERRADDATRDVEAWLKCYYMQDRVGEEFIGTIASVTGFGLFVALDDIYVEGLVHISELGSDYFHFDKTRHQIVGERTGVRYRLGDRVHVKIVRVSLDTTRIDFSLLSADGKLMKTTETAPNTTPKTPKKSTQSKRTAVKSTPQADAPAKKPRRRKTHKPG
jgi:ribonuclease R